VNDGSDVLLRQMKAAGVAVNVITYNSLLKVCERAGQWERAAALFQVGPPVIGWHFSLLSCDWLTLLAGVL
jgi:pentatricopeptide repeat protein